MKIKLYIVGAGSVGGHIARNIAGYGGRYEIAGFLDDDPAKIGTSLFDYSVLGPVEDALELMDANIVVGIAFPNTKEAVIQTLSQNSTLVYPVLIHNKAWVSEDVSVGKGTVIYPGTCINYGSQIGNFVVMNMNCSLGHHTLVGDFSSLAPGVNTGGHTQIGRLVDMGIGASTLQDVKLGDHSVIGGQSMVIRDVKKETCVAGVPAKQIG